MSISSYKDLVVWQKSMDLVAEVYKLVKKLPKEETYGLSDQMRRAAVSIPSNIAEGKERNFVKEYIHFLSIARGSKAELETQLLIGIRIGYFTEGDILKLLSILDEIGKMLNILIKKLSTNT